MNPKILFAALAMALSAPAWASAAIPDLSGDWEGVVTDAMPFPLILHVRDEVRLDSPDRGIFGLLGEAKQTGDHVDIVFANGGAFEGVLAGDNLSGEYLRGPAALPLVFKRKHSPHDAPAPGVDGSRAH